ncbi:uncharacterized protein BROUX77_006853 [Berkeleyomyces rouxiae]|uniref:uncharacterized protein n=1 Tax=Berkeleyomyces rouxiae TaxID=2035830 RepID=UPI003B82A528
MDRFIIRKPRASGGFIEKRATKKPRLSDVGNESADSASSTTPIKLEQDEECDFDLAVPSGDSVLFGNEETELSALEFSAQLEETPPVGAMCQETEGTQDAIRKEEEHPTPTGYLWVKGESSLYVDAFNLALDTVLQDEIHLFDDKEQQVFREWRALDYQEQYLYVRLFLRKEAAWHRISRLGYHSDISDLEATIKVLERNWPFLSFLKSSEPGKSCQIKIEPDSLPQIPLPHSKTEPEDVKHNTSSCTQQKPSVETKMQLGSQSVFMKDVEYGASFTFIDASVDHITALEDAIVLLNLEELKALAKETKASGKSKSELCRSIIQITREQSSLLSMGVTSRRSSSGLDKKSDSPISSMEAPSCRKKSMLDKIMAVTGPCIRLSRQTAKLFQRVHLVFYRSTQWTEKSLTTIILAKISRRNFPEYVVHRSSTIFSSRANVIEFEAALCLESEVDALLEVGSSEFSRVIEIVDSVYHSWKVSLKQEQEREWMFEPGEGAYLRRFIPAHIYTRIIHKGLFVLGRLKNYAREHSLLTELLAQRLFHRARRGSWYQRKALLEEHYMHAVDLAAGETLTEKSEALKKKWKKKAAETCEQALQDNDCHVIFHYDLQKRLIKLERQLRIPKRLQHDFGHVSFRRPLEHTVQGIQLKPEAEEGSGVEPTKSTRTLWLDLHGSDPTAIVTVEEMSLSWYRAHGGWKGYHAEGGIVRTLFAYLFYDILFLPVPNVFQTAFQNCPLDLFSDTFYATRAGEINRRLALISNGGASDLVADVSARERPRRTSVVGLNWDFAAEDIQQLVRCFPPAALAMVCTVLAQDYRMRGSGMPDLLLWRERDGGSGNNDDDDDNTETDAPGECMFVEVKSAGDRVSDTQRLWMHVLGGAGIPVAVCRTFAREVRSK